MSFFSAEKITSTKPKTSTPKCGGSCKLNKTCHTFKMKSYGTGEEKILFVGEVPGKDEDESGSPMVGKAAVLLKDLSAQHGIELSDCLKTNAIRCRPPKGRDATDQELDSCHLFLNQEIERFKPRVIIPLGAKASESIISADRGKRTTGIEKMAGMTIPSRKWNAWICPTFHPSYVLHKDSRVLRKIVSNHLKVAFQKETHPWDAGIPNERSQINLVDEDTAISIMKEYKKQSGTMAFDYETTGLKPDAPGHDIVCCSICWMGVETMSFTMKKDETRTQLKRLLRSNRIRKIASNLKYEARWTKTILGIDVKNWWWDTMLAAHTLDNRRGICSVKFQAYVRMGLPEYDSHIQEFFETEDDQGANGINKIHQLDEKSLLAYCGMDSLIEYKVAEHQMREMGYPWE